MGAKKTPWAVIILAFGNFVSIVLNNFFDIDLSKEIATIAEGSSLIIAGIVQMLLFLAKRKQGEQ